MQRQTNRAEIDNLEKQQTWRVVNDAPFQISPAPPPLKANGETLKELGFNNIDELLVSIEKKTLYRSVSFSPDGRFIASGSDDYTVKLWDIQNQKLAHTFEGHSSDVNSVAFSPDGRFIASGAGDFKSSDHTVKLWDIQNQKLAHTFEGHSSSVNSVAFSPDGRFIASGAGNYKSSDNTVKLWDIQNQKLAHTFEGHSSDVNSVAFSPDGRFIASGGSDDHTVKLWDIQTQKLAHTFEGHSSSVNSVAFSPDGRFIASGAGDYKSSDNTVKLWDIQTWSNEMTLLSSKVDSWLLIKNNGIVFRAEHGNLLRKIADNNDWLSVFPIDMKLESNLSMSINPRDFSILAGQGTEAELKVDIRNTGLEAAFWLKLKPIQSEDGVVRLDAPDNQLKSKGQSFWKASHITRLEAGETATIYARISTNLKFPAEFVQPGIRPLTVTVVSANGTEVSQTIDVDVQLPRLEWQKASLEADGSTMKVKLQNTGNAVFAKGFVQLLAKGLNETSEEDIITPKQTITELQPDQSIELAFILPKQADLFYVFKILFNPELLQLQGQSNQLPIFAWNLTTQWINWLLLWLIAIVLPLIAFSIVYLRRYRHPLLVELSDNPDSLLLIQPEQLSEARSRLQKTKRLETVLSKSNVTSRTLKNGIAFFATDSIEQKIQHLEKRLGTQATKIQECLWELQLPQNFPLNLQHCLVYFPQKKTAADDVFTDLKAIPEISRSTTLLIGKDSDYQRQLYTKSKDPSNKFVAPSGAELTQLLLSPEPEIVLAEILAGQLALTLLSPYQLGGGVNNKSVFFGRQEIIDHILNREPANYLLVGGRQLGKSSLLKALERRFQDQGDVICFYLALASEVLIPRLISLLKLPKESDINALTEYAEKSDKRLVFLIDEADKFIATEREHDYQILNTLRQMSEEGRCFFILAGFWELYQHAVLDYKSPLKNFAETIQIGALEDEACRLLATEPMKTMRLEYANSRLVEGLLENTGGRANLIAIVCHQIIEHLESNQRIINREDVQRAINSEKTLNALRGWGAMTDDQQACRLDRIIVYTTVELDRFTLDQLLELLKQHQIKLIMEMIEQSLARLELGFVLGREKKRQYKYQVPLFQEMILTESPATKLRLEIDDWNAAQDI